jgi:DNA-3-methyladenine glycosylase I
VSEPKGPLAGPDGQLRCPWGLSAPEYLAYHDEEWGRPVRDDAGMFERLCLEAFQSGLSWLTILRKRENFRAAFDGFQMDVIAGYGDADVARLLADTGIVRNRAKIEAAVNNARAALDLPGGLAKLVWGFAPQAAVGRLSGSESAVGSDSAAGRPPPRTLADLDSATPESKALSRELKRRGFTFTGPVTVYSTMQACGLVDDHLADCFRRGAYR